jgi:DNA-binding transcriptional MerR regulator/methylmalonyl-CoA mutase cobalamin-binding subunit
MHTVKHAAELTGIPADTIRMWERRYGVVSPTRSDGGYRLYDETALRRLTAMRSLVDSGWAPSQAARRVLEDEAKGVTAAPETRDVRGDIEVLARIGRDFDGQALDAALDEAFALGTFEQVVDGWLMPALEYLGNAWEGGAVSVAGEHFVSATVQRRLAALFDAAGQSRTGARVVVGLVRGSRHELGVLAFATALRRAGLDVLYVGADLPPEDWAETVHALSAAAVVLGVPAPEDVEAVRETVDSLHAAPGHVQVFLGGGQQSAVGGDAVLLGHAIGPGAEQVVQVLSGARVPAGAG